jgi:hypothetical protein
MHENSGAVLAGRQQRSNKGAHELKRCTAAADLILLLRRQRFCSYERPSQSPRPDQCVLRQCAGTPVSVKAVGSG